MRMSLSTHFEHVEVKEDGNFVLHSVKYIIKG
jgi:hypothetical protein